MLTYFKSCQYKMTVNVLHETEDDIKLLMPTADYNAIWRKIAMPFLMDTSRIFLPHAPYRVCSALLYFIFLSCLKSFSLLRF